MLRHTREAVLESFIATFKYIEDANEVAERLKSARHKDAILLPPINFHVDGERRLSELFLELRQGKRNWKDRFNELTPQEFNSERLKHLKKGKVQYCFQDHREIVFVQPHPSAYHGGQWQADKIDSITGKHILRGLYRFGAPIPQGFQHDAQFADNKEFQNQAFDCAERGKLLASGSHANIYPNDFVRPAHKKIK